MFDHSVAVIASISRSLKKYINITSILTQILFMSYYAYLIVINVTNIHFLVAYSLIEGLALVILIFNIVATFADLDYAARRINMKYKRLVRYFSWAIKLAVIIFNISMVVRGLTSEAGKIFLIFSAIFLLLQILLTIVSTLFTYYLDLLLFGLKMDYETLIDGEASNSKPVGKMLNNVTKDMDYKDNINEISIKHEMRGTLKREIEKEFPLKVNNRVIKRKKAERIILHYYKKANKYYLHPNKLNEVLEELKANHITYLTSDDKLFTFLFFSYNHITKHFQGLSEYALKLIIGTLLFINDGNDRTFVDVAFNAIRKELFDIPTWSKVIDKSSNPLEYHKVINIINEQKMIYKMNREETILSEFKDLTIQEVEKQMDLPKPVSKIIHHFMDRNKKK